VLTRCPTEQSAICTICLWTRLFRCLFIGHGRLLKFSPRLCYSGCLLCFPFAVDETVSFRDRLMLGSIYSIFMAWFRNDHQHQLLDSPSTILSCFRHILIKTLPASAGSDSSESDSDYTAPPPDRKQEPSVFLRAVIVSLQQPEEIYLLIVLPLSNSFNLSSLPIL
jgi:hypothetical protein